MGGPEPFVASADGGRALSEAGSGAEDEDEQERSQNAGGRYTIMFLYLGKPGVSNVFNPAALQQSTRGHQPCRRDRTSRLAGGCSSHGLCRRGRCFCDAGWSGEACATAAERASNTSASRPASPSSSAGGGT